MASPGHGVDRKVPVIEEEAEERVSREAKEAAGVVQKRQKPGRHGKALLNGMMKDTRSMYISPAGLSTLDIRTRLRIAEAELAIVQREVADLLTEKRTLESNTRTYEESWKFAVQECGRVVEQRDELYRKLLSLENAVSAVHHPEIQKDTKKKKVTKADLEQCKVALETQTRVCETLEHERDQAYDDYQFAQAQLHTLMHQYQQLANTCSDVARQRDKARADVQLLREELHRYEPEPEPPGLSTLSRSCSKKLSESDAPPGDFAENSSDGPPPDIPLSEQIKELKEDRNNFRSACEQAIKRSEQYQKQLYRAEEDRRQALATSEALTALWQKKFEKAQMESFEMSQELLSAQDRISHLSEQLAMIRLQSRIAPQSSPSDGELSAHFIQDPHSIAGGGHLELFPPPQRTASYHGSLSISTGNHRSSVSSGSYLTHPSRSSGSINRLSGRDHRGGHLQSTHELIGPLGDHTYLSRPAKRQNRTDYNEYGAGTGSSSQSTEDEASWI